MQPIFGRRNYYCADIQTFPHPNGDVYAAIKIIDKSKRPERWNVCIVRYSSGSCYEVKWFKHGVDWQDSFSAFSLAIQPDGTGVVFGGFKSNSIDGEEAQFVPQWFTVPNLAPPYTPGAQGTFSVSAQDTYARELANVAISESRGAKDAARSALDKVNGFNDTVRKAMSDAVKKIKEIPAGLTQKQVEDIAWGKAGDRIYADLQNSGSPLASFIWSKAMDAAWAKLVETGVITWIKRH